MDELRTTTVAGRVVRVIASDRDDGDMHPQRVPEDRLAERQRRLTGTTWPMLDQVHGAAVVEPDPTDTMPVGDVAVSRRGATPVAVWAADCAPIALIGSDASVAVIHAGWRGLASGVVQAGVGALSRNERVVEAVLGPVIHPCCYEFSPRDIDTVATGVGTSSDTITGTTADGAIALDIPAAIRTVLDRAGVPLTVAATCTGCDERWFSHRIRNERERHAVIAWSEPS